MSYGWYAPTRATNFWGPRGGGGDWGEDANFLVAHGKFSKKFPRKPQKVPKLPKSMKILVEKLGAPREHGFFHKVEGQKFSGFLGENLKKRKFGATNLWRNH